MIGVLGHVAEQTVHAVANAQATVAGLHVDVAGSLLEGICEHACHETDDGSIRLILPIAAHAGGHVLFPAGVVVPSQGAAESAG